MDCSFCSIGLWSWELERCCCEELVITLRCCYPLTNPSSPANTPPLPKQNAPAPTHERRQQCGGRHGAVRARAGLSGPVHGRHRQRRRLRALCRIRHYPAQRVSVAEDSDDGVGWFDGCVAAGVRGGREEGRGEGEGIGCLGGEQRRATAVVDGIVEGASHVSALRTMTVLFAS